MKGYIMLPIFTVKMRSDGDFEMTCSDFLGWIFEIFFAPFWTGKAKIRRSEFAKKEAER